jgi:hypothetical protein
MIEPSHPDFSLRRQCELLGLNRSTWYYQPAGESAYVNLHPMMYHHFAANVYHLI